MGEFLRATEQALDEAEHFREWTERVVRRGLGVRQAARDQFAPPAPVQKRPKSRGASVGAELLVGELDLDGLAGAFELDLLGYRLVKRAGARRLGCFHSPPFTSQTVATFQSHGCG